VGVGGKKKTLAEDTENPWTYYPRANAVIMPKEVSKLELLVLRSEELKLLVR
jgi:hypothetical protein